MYTRICSYYVQEYLFLCILYIYKSVYVQICIDIYIYVCTHMCVCNNVIDLRLDISLHARIYTYGVASVSRIDNITGLCCKRAL